MRLVTIIIIVVALGVSGVTAMLLMRYMQSQTPKAKVEHEIVPAEKVLVAKFPLSAGSIVIVNKAPNKEPNVTWQVWPREGIDKTYVLEKSNTAGEYEGAAVKRGIDPGEPITAAKVIRPGENSFLSAVLAPGMRAASARVNVETAVAGFISPNDRVDLILISGVSVVIPTTVVKGGQPDTQLTTASRQFGEPILTDLKVLAIDQSTQELGSGARVGRTITFEVTPKQAEILAIARKKGELYLVLRSHTRPESEPSRREFPFTSELEITQSIRGDLQSRYLSAMSRSGIGAVDVTVENRSEPLNDDQAATELRRTEGDLNKPPTSPLQEPLIPAPEPQITPKPDPEAKPLQRKADQTDEVRVLRGTESTTLKFKREQ
jgi:pilus assembly protein CpaB